jgi:hypothetical protein
MEQSAGYPLAEMIQSQINTFLLSTYDRLHLVLNKKAGPE